MSDLKADILFVGPALTSPISGGTLYNRYVIEELRKAQHSVRVVSIPDREEIRKSTFSSLVVDSLALEHVPGLRTEGRRSNLSLLLHYLPSFVSHERACKFCELTLEEQRALEGSDSLIVTGSFMRNAVQSWAELTQPVHLVEPGFSLAHDLNSSPEPPRSACSIRAVMLAPLMESKGVARFLEEIARRCLKSDQFEVLIAGRVGVEADHEEQLRSLVATNTLLTERVQFLGELPHERALHLLGRADFFISCSRMESYGMALMEARQLGVFALALDRGNAREHAQPGQCEVFSDEGELAQEFLLTVRSRGHEKHGVKSLREPRSWSTVATEFLEALQSADS